MIFDLTGELIIKNDLDNKSIKYVEQIIQETIDYLDVKVEDFMVSQSLYETVYNLFGITKNQLNQVINIVKTGERHIEIDDESYYVEDYKELQKVILNEMKTYFLHNDPPEEK